MYLMTCHELLDCFFQTVETQFEHGKYLLNDTDGPGVVPFLFRLRVQPDGVAEDRCQEFQPVDAGTTSRWSK